MTRPRSRSAGFSLIELTIAMIIIAFALFAVLSMTLHTSSSKEAMREAEIAKEAASRKIEEIRGLPWGTTTPTVIPSVVYTYATQNGTLLSPTLPREVVIPNVAPFLVDGLSYTVPSDPWNTSTNNPLKKGKGRVIIHGINSTGTPPVVADPVYLVDYEIIIEWKGIRGLSRYTTRMMLARDQGK
jgi:prepilin-type N-terminal cleavage/methylation domain-containing protein